MSGQVVSMPYSVNKILVELGKAINHPVKDFNHQLFKKLFALLGGFDEVLLFLQKTKSLSLTVQTILYWVILGAS